MIVICNNYIHRGGGRGDNYYSFKQKQHNQGFALGTSDELRSFPTCERRVMECADGSELSCCSA